MTGLRPEGYGRLMAAGCVRWRSGGDSGSAFGHACGVRVQAPSAPGFKRFRGFKGWWWRLRRRFIKVSVTGLVFYVIWHDKHSADWLAALASPYPASPDFPLFRGQNKTPRSLAS